MRKRYFEVEKDEQDEGRLIKKGRKREMEDRQVRKGEMNV